MIHQTVLISCDARSCTRTYVQKYDIATFDVPMRIITLEREDWQITNDGACLCPEHRIDIPVGEYR